MKIRDLFENIVVKSDTPDASSNPTSLVNDFLTSATQGERAFYKVRDNCGPAAIDMHYWLKKNKGIETTRVFGYFVADDVVYDKEDFTPAMKQSFINSGLDWNNSKDRYDFIKNNQKYAEWNEIPHFWLEDSNGKIYDPTGQIQFIDTGLAKDLKPTRYKKETLTEKQNANAGIMSNPAFRQWFGKSVLVDAAGNPLVVFHGTARAFSAFDVATIGDVWNDDKAGFFFTNNPGSDMASGYANAAARSGGAPNVMPVYIRLENPYTFDDYAFEMGYPPSNSDPMHPKHAAEYLDGRGLIDWFDINKHYVINAAQEGGYDGILLIDPSTKLTRSGLPENLVVVFSPNQIKSKFNRGTFRTDTNDISESSDYNLQFYKNPSPKALHNLTKRTAHKRMRGLYHDGNTYWWNADDAIHAQAAKFLGIPYNYLTRMDAAVDSVSGNYYTGGDDEVPQDVIQKYDIENADMYEASGEAGSDTKKPTMSIQFKTWERGGVPRHSFSVMIGDKKIAYGEIEKDNEWDDDRGASVQDIVVDYNYRRKGIATKIYDAIERKFNYKLHPSDDVRPDGKEFWKYRSNMDEDYKRMANDPTSQDLKDVAEWMNTTPDKIKIVVKQEPIDKFLTQIREMYGTFDEFPKDAKRTNKIVKLLKNGEKPLPIYVEENDPDLFVMEGNHRKVAFWLVGMDTIPVAYVSVADDIDEDFSAVSSKNTDEKIDAQERKRNLDNFLRGNHPSVPNILYHGSRSDADFEVFKPSFGTYGTGIYLTNKPNVASDFAMGVRGGETDEKLGGRVIPLYVSMQNPFVDEYLRNPSWKKYIEKTITDNFDSQLWRTQKYSSHKDYIIQALNNGTATIRDLFIDENNNVMQELGCNEIAETIHRSGFDGIIVKRPDGSTEYVVYNPEQVKSAIGNIGTFDPHKPSINEDKTDNIFYHVTPAKNVKWIMEEGLTPSTGSASSSYGETEERVYLFPSLIDAQDAVNNWLGDQYENDILALLQVDASDINLKSDVEWEYYTNQIIPPNKITILSMDM